jgi:hypothetical protein
MSVKSSEGFEKISKALINDEKLVEQIGKINKDYITLGKGATQQIIETIITHGIK